MKKALTFFFTVAAALLILDSVNAGQALLMFFLAGHVPGTSTVVSASTMLEGYLLLAGFIGARLTIAATTNFRMAILRRRVA
jgi:hypothetical protein